MACKEIVVNLTVGIEKKFLSEKGAKRRRIVLSV